MTKQNLGSKKKSQPSKPPIKTKPTSKKSHEKIVEKYHFLQSVFEKKYSEPKTELIFNSPFQLLISTMLAAQCTDKRVNIATKPFFEKYPTVQDMEKLTIEEITFYIKSINFFNNKAKGIYGICKMLIKTFHGVVPETLEELTSLSGVGRKTAHVIMSNCFGKSVLAVDTHVFRVSNRLGLVDAKTPLDVELQLMKVIPTKNVSNFHHYLIFHGRYVCKARSPLCAECEVASACEYFQNRS